MNLQLKFVTEILRPWERLNQELVKQVSIDSSVSELISIAGDLAIKISHFPEVAEKKHVRTNKSLKEFSIIVDIADKLKHNKMDDEKDNKLSISSQFEGNSKNEFRFIRNSVKVNHNTHGKYDFLEISKKAIDFLISKLSLNIYWNPPILEAPEIFDTKVFLEVHLIYQITWQGLEIEFFKRDSDGNLIHYDPPEWIFHLQSPNPILANSYFEYIIELFKKSISQGSEIFYNVNFPIEEDGKEEIFSGHALIKSCDKTKESFLVQILEKENCSLQEIQMCEELANKKAIDKMILVSRNEFSSEVKKKVTESLNKICLVSIGKFDAYNIPIDYFSKKFNHTYDVKITAVHNIKLGVLEEDAELFSKFSGKTFAELGNNFSFDKENLISPILVCQSLIKLKENETSGRAKLNHSPRSHVNIYYKIDDKFVKIGVEAEFDWECKTKEVRMPILTYNKTHLGISIWNSETYLNDSNNKYQIKTSVFKYGDTSAIGIGIL